MFQVLIPVFALGRAQELCILLETYWERMNLKVPIYFSLGLTEKVLKPEHFVLHLLHLAENTYKSGNTITIFTHSGLIKGHLAIWYPN